MNLNNEVLVRSRAAIYRKSKRVERNIFKERLEKLYAKRRRIMSEMEQEAEIEGGVIADIYGERLNRIDEKIAEII